MVGVRVGTVRTWVCLAFAAGVFATLASAPGAQANHLTCNGMTTTVDGTTGIDNLTGTAGADIVNLQDGFDTYNAGGGNDVVCGGPGNDTLRGEGDNDYIDGEAGHDGSPTAPLDGGPGDDTVNGGDGADHIASDAGTDTYDGGPNIPNMAEFDFIDFVSSPALVTVSLQAGTASGDGSDTLAGFEGVLGSTFADDITGSNGDERELNGGDGGDTVNGLDGNDSLEGGFCCADGADTLDGGAGSDSLRDGNLGDDEMDGGPGNDLLTAQTGADDLDGGADNDTLDGDVGGDTLFGSGGDDLIRPDPSVGATGDDTVDGGLEGPNGDTVQFRTANAVTANLVGGTATGEGTDTLAEIENVTGGDGGDNITGDGGPNTLNGGRGVDTIAAAGGPDRLLGDCGADDLDGGMGDDALEGDTALSIFLGFGTCPAANDDVDGDAGSDTADYYAGGDTAFMFAPISVDLAADTATGEGTDTLTDVENATGSGMGDTMNGDGGPNRFEARDGDDFIDGRAGADIEDGGSETDTCLTDDAGDMLLSCEIVPGGGTPPPGDPPADPPAGDGDPPETRIDKGPKKKSKKRKATFEFSADEAGVSFQCSLDGAPFTPCSSPFQTKVKKKPKKHSLQVRATDAAGNVDATPASHSWKVKKKKKK